MKSIVRSALPILLCAAFFTSTARSQPATLTVDLAKTAHKVSPTLYGLMTEEINYSYDGGLYAEMVRNRTFQEHGWDGIAHWTVVENGDSAAPLAIDCRRAQWGLAAYFRLEVKRAGPASTGGVLNEGYWGMAVRPNTTYKGSLYARADYADLGPVSVSLISDNSGKAAATATPAVSTELEAIQLHPHHQQTRTLLREPSTPHRRPLRQALARPRLPLSAHLQKPRQRQPSRHHGDAGRHAPHVPPLARRQLPRRGSDRGTLRLEEHHRPARRPPHPPQPLELPVLRRPRAA